MVHVSTFRVTLVYCKSFLKGIYCEFQVHFLPIYFSLSQKNRILFMTTISYMHSVIDFWYSKTVLKFILNLFCVQFLYYTFYSLALTLDIQIRETLQDRDNIHPYILVKCIVRKEKVLQSTTTGFS